MYIFILFLLGEKELASQPKADFESKTKRIIKLPALSKEEIKCEMNELKMNLILANITVEDLSRLFENYEGNDMITIFELQRNLKRAPLSLKGDILKIARYLIEPKNQNEISYCEMAEERIAVVLDHLASFVGNYTIFNDDENEAKVKKSLLSVKDYLLFFK